jgi:hypothetical protein
MISCRELTIDIPDSGFSNTPSTFVLTEYNQGMPMCTGVHKTFRKGKLYCFISGCSNESALDTFIVDAFNFEYHYWKEPYGHPGEFDGEVLKWDNLLTLRRGTAGGKQSGKK